MENKEKKYLYHEVQESVFQLIKLDAFDEKEFLTWVRKTNPSWLPFFTKKKLLFWRVRKLTNEFLRRVKYSARILIKGF